MERTVSRYVLLLEPDTPIKLEDTKDYAERFHRLLQDSNKEYKVVVDRGSLDKPLVLIQQQQTHALWREFKLMKGSSANQVKPVRILDTPMKQKFFFGLIEKGQEIPDLPFLRKK